MARTALKQICPHCGVGGAHRQIKTEKLTRFPDYGAAYYQRLFPQGLSYRCRIRQCESCDKEFETVEISQADQFAFMRECSRLEKEVVKLKEGLRRVSEFQNELGMRCRSYQENVSAINAFMRDMVTVLDPASAQELTKTHK